MKINKNNIAKGLKYLSEIGWSDLIDPRWTLDVKHDLENSDLDLTEEDIIEICKVAIYPEPDWNSTESIYNN